MNYQKLDLIQGSPEWLEARLNHVTASNVPSLFALSPYKTALEYGTEILTKREKEELGKQDLFRHGHEVEKAAREWVRSHLNIELLPTVVVSSKIRCLLASLDGLDEQKGMVFEAKYVGRDALKEAKAGKIKPHHECQVQAQLLATGFDKAIYFAMDPDGESVVVDIKADPTYMADIGTKVNEFWRLIQAGVLPEATDKDVLKVEDQDMIRMALLHREIKCLSAQYDAIEEKVLAKYAHAGRIQGEGVSITKYWAKGTVDWAKLASARKIPAEEQERFRKAGALRTKVTIK